MDVTIIERYMERLAAEQQNQQAKARVDTSAAVVVAPAPVVQVPEWPDTVPMALHKEISVPAATAAVPTSSVRRGTSWEQWLAHDLAKEMLNNSARANAWTINTLSGLPIGQQQQAYQDWSRHADVVAWSKAFPGKATMVRTKLLARMDPSALPPGYMRGHSLIRNRNDTSHVVDIIAYPDKPGNYIIGIVYDNKFQTSDGLTKIWKKRGFDRVHKRYRLGQTFSEMAGQAKQNGNSHAAAALTVAANRMTPFLLRPVGSFLHNQP